MPDFGFYPGGLAGKALPRQIIAWFTTALIIEQEAARHHLSLNTCNGCHGAETATEFQHGVEAAIPKNEPANLFGFLTGITTTVNLAGTELPGDLTRNPTYSYNDLARRAQVLMEDANDSCLLKIRVPVTLATH
jgi:hypothetical protein